MNIYIYPAHAGTVSPVFIVPENNEVYNYLKVN
jgi:hypothetical protein